jgi:LPXTG-motif cell wall-anchored protein
MVKHISMKKNKLVVLAFGLAIAIALSVITSLAKPAYAQEITPTPGTYSYGSTSEFSPYVALTSSSTLAPTGDSQTTGYMAVGMLVLAASGIFVYVMKNRFQLIKIRK